MSPVGWLHERSRAFTRHSRTRPSPSGLAALLTVHGELRFSKPRGIPPPNIFGCSFERPRTLTECLWTFTGTFGFHRTPPGVHRASPDAHSSAFGRSPGTLGRPTGGSILHGRAFRGSPARPAVARTTSAVHRRCVVFATSILGCSPELSGSTRVSPETHRSQPFHTRRPAAIASFR